jgi:antimicrobial peptide system SdpA family protein
MDVGITTAVARAAGRALPGRPVSADRPSPHAPVRAFGTFSLATAIAFAAVVLYVAQTYLPTTAVSLPLYAQIRPVARSLVPEGWAFFTRSPREERVLPYVLRDGRWTDVHAPPHAEPQHAFGLNRVSRAQGVELGLLYGGLPSNAWTSCRFTDAARCLAGTAISLTLRNVSPDPTICGDVALLRQEPVPWAWAHSTTAMPIKYVRLAVRC